MKLYNLTYEDKNFVSGVAPTNLPEDNYCFVEIVYDTGVIKEIKGTYVKAGDKKECVLSELNIENHIMLLNKFLQREDIDKDKIHLNFVENISDDNDRILKIFIISISSYLIYFNFLSFPYMISLELLNNEKYKYFTSFVPITDVEKSFIEQVATLHRYFSEIFDLEVNIIDEIKEYKRRMFLDIDKKLESIEALKAKLSEIFKIF